LLTTEPDKKAAFTRNFPTQQVLSEPEIILIFLPGMLEFRQRRLGACPTPDGTEAVEEIMAEPLRNYQARIATGGRAKAATNDGLRAYMIRVYSLMALGVVITGEAA